jgi:hypothetical protein
MCGERRSMNGKDWTTCTICKRYIVCPHGTG